MDFYEDETIQPIGTTALLPCSRHRSLQHRLTVIADPGYADGRVWHCIDPSPDVERLFETAYVDVGPQLSNPDYSRDHVT